MNVTQEGNLYFIYGLKMKSQTDDVKSLEFDYTFVESRDYVPLTATCISKNSNETELTKSENNSTCCIL